MGLLFFNFIGRGIFSPLLPIFEAQFGVDHSRASTIFLIISLSMSVSMVFSGFISHKLQHRGTLLLYEFMLGLSLIICAFSPSFLWIQLSSVLLGISCGLYAPSGIASVTNLAGKKHWGKAMGIHELGPNLGLIAAPLLIGFAVPRFSWKTVMLLIGIANWINGLMYAVKGRGADFYGSPPNLKNLRLIFSNRSFWVLACFLIFAASSAIGIYSILPTYLISAKGFAPQPVNTVIGLSRILGILFILGTGYLVDRFGVKIFIAITLSFSALLTMCLGLFDGTLLLVVVFFQPMIITSFFPVSSTAISTITRPETRNVAFSMIVPFASGIGAGLTPLVLGILGESGRFSLGFIGLGILTLASLSLLPLLRIGKLAELD